MIRLLLLTFACSLNAQTTAEALVHAGHFKQAQVILDRRLQANRSDGEALLLLSKVKLAANNSEASSQLADEAVRLDGKNPRYHAQLANSLAAEAEHAGALRQISVGRRCKKEIDLTLPSILPISMPSGSNC